MSSLFKKINKMLWMPHFSKNYSKGDPSCFSDGSSVFCCNCCLLASLPARSHLWLRHLQWPHVSFWIVLLLRKPLSKHPSLVVPQGQFTKITFSKERLRNKITTVNTGKDELIPVTYSTCSNSSNGCTSVVL